MGRRIEALVVTCGSIWISCVEAQVWMAGGSVSTQRLAQSEEADQEATMGRSRDTFPARITQSLCKRSSVAYESKERREVWGSQHAQKHGYFIENPSSLRPAVSRVALAPCLFFFESLR